MEFDIVNGHVVQKQIKPKIEFFTHAKLDLAASENEGRRVYKDTTYIKIKPQGCRDFLSRKATEEDKRLYPKEYALFNTEASPVGTDVALLIPSLGDLAEARALGITTVEKLADIEVLPDNLIQYRNKAKAFMELQNGTNWEGQEATNSDRSGCSYEGIQAGNG